MLQIFIERVAARPDRRPAQRRLRTLMLCACAAFVIPAPAVAAGAQSAEFYLVREVAAGACKIVTIPPSTTDVKLLADGRLFETEAAARDLMGTLAECADGDTNVGHASHKAAQAARPHRVRVKKTTRRAPARRARESVAVSASQEQGFGFWFGGWR